MVNEIKKFKWAQFHGKTEWVQCFTHILNLIVQVILRPFGSHKKKNSGQDNFDKSMDLDESNQDDEEDTEHQIELYNEGTHLNNEDSNDPINSGCITNPIDDQELELETGDINDLSDKDNDDFQAILQKLNKLPNSKALFVEICQEKECLTPHNVERDVRTRWNSTLVQLSSIH
ncbi:hypothetical protein PTTG_02656 [Puccinia triticina 1-1 BBBD Race 1]|uniref:Uncharacterized protein n=1 Tax=Puccinia triticina (isolate 1-1 / race 1 (BBBD)) TaxID=630390 RepID=A0A0C4EPF5_PUCT1|nr:hypothetical protein PTTG_02656 [Puccinia triticina 1-1 BBBD Race 1]